MIKRCQAVVVELFGEVRRRQRTKFAPGEEAVQGGGAQDDLECRSSWIVWWIGNSAKGCTACGRAVVLQDSCGGWLLTHGRRDAIAAFTVPRVSGRCGMNLPGIHKTPRLVLLRCACLPCRFMDKKLNSKCNTVATPFTEQFLTLPSSPWQSLKQTVGTCLLTIWARAVGTPHPGESDHIFFLLAVKLNANRTVGGRAAGGVRPVHEPGAGQHGGGRGVRQERDWDGGESRLAPQQNATHANSCESCS